MNRSIRFFSAGTAGIAGIAGSGSENVNSSKKGGRKLRGRVPGSTGPSKSARSPSREEEESLLRTSGSSASTASGSSCQSFDDSFFAASSLCATAQESTSLSQRLLVHMSSHSWKVSPHRGDPIASLRLPDHRDEMLLEDSEGRECGVIIPTNSSTSEGCHRYIIYSFAPCFANQKPTIMGDPTSGVPSFYHYARVQAETVDLTGGAACCHRFSCRTEDGRQFGADKIMSSSFRSRAFCIKETTNNQAGALPRSAARVTCLSAKNRELLVYPRVDPLLILSFVAIMEEVVLVAAL